MCPMREFGKAFIFDRVWMKRHLNDIDYIFPPQAKGKKWIVLCHFRQGLIKSIC